MKFVLSNLLAAWFIGYVIRAEEGKRTKKTTLVGRMDELKNAPPEKHMYVFGMDIPQTGIANLNLDSQ